jgi:signal transduction histidine kinase/ActR/RegA family two-component response regulator
LVLFLIWAVAALFKSRKTKVAAVQAEAKAREQRIRAEEAVKSADEKTAFFSNISHDMRTPLNAVTGFAELALREGEAGKKDAYLLKIKNAGALLNSLIDDTLTLFKANRGKLELKLKPFDTQELLDTITGPIEQLASAKGVEFVVDVTHLRRRMVLADKLNLGKIFLNLLSNAVKFTSAGGHVWLTVADDAAAAENEVHAASEQKTAEDGVQTASEQNAAETGAGTSANQTVPTAVVVTVRDDGIGMSPEFLTRIFEPFTQERRPGYEYLGTGLGMSIVSNLVKLMNGTVQVQSELGRGTIFTVRLPLAEAKVAANTETPQMPGSLAGQRILLCEDNAINREIALALLKHWGLEAESAVNGQEGVARFTAAPAGYYGAILMDIRMPVLDGLSAAQKIRALDRDDAKNIPIIAMSGNGFDEDISAAKAAGMNDYVLKPIEPDKLFKVLETRMQKN